FEGDAALARRRAPDAGLWEGCLDDAGCRVAWQVSGPNSGTTEWCIDNPLSCVGFGLGGQGARARGVLELARRGASVEPIRLDGWRLSRCEASGGGMPEYLVQVRCARFDGAPTVRFDALCVQGRRATLRMPHLRYGRLQLGERQLIFAPLPNLWQAPCTFGPARCEMRLTSREATVDVRLRADPEAAHVAVHQTPTMFSHWFVSPLAHLELQVCVDGAVHTLTSEAASYLEVQPPPNRHMWVEMT
ncbi:MAG TPA: hypothetical protein VFH51_19390, partial [Myxococcota bacterium]|nr:hypothetical protein [Myxococcota bacterium]